MSSIKEIAALAKVSQGTASMVLNGKGDQFRISPATQQRIIDAARQLDYQPNIYARRLRSHGEKIAPIIALFWTTDPRSQLIGRYLKGIQQAVSKQTLEYELLIQPYEGSRLHEIKSLSTGTRYNGAIIALPTESDENYLNEAQLNVPLVLYQRDSDKYCSVNVDSYLSGQKVANHFARLGHQRAALIVPHISSAAIRLRMRGFQETCREHGIQIAEQHIAYADFSERGGYEAALAVYRAASKPTAIFCISDQMAVGVLYALHELGIRVPDEVELVGHDDDDASQFTLPSLTTVHLPVEEMAASCVKMLIDLMSHKVDPPASIRYESTMVFRGSSPQPKQL